MAETGRLRHDIECTADIVLDGTTIQTVADGMGTGNAETFTFPGTYWNDSESVFYFKVEHGGTVNGQAHANIGGDEVYFLGRSAKILREATGLWLRIGSGGTQVILR